MDIFCTHCQHLPLPLHWAWGIGPWHAHIQQYTFTWNFSITYSLPNCSAKVLEHKQWGFVSYLDAQNQTPASFYLYCGSNGAVDTGQSTVKIGKSLLSLQHYRRNDPKVSLTSSSAAATAEFAARNHQREGGRHCSHTHKRCVVNSRPQILSSGNKQVKRRT